MIKTRRKFYAAFAALALVFAALSPLASAFPISGLTRCSISPGGRSSPTTSSEHGWGVRRP